MKNSDSAAMPQTWVPDYGNSPPVTVGGLTKREHFACKIMAGFAANPGCGESPVTELADAAVYWADALLAALEKE